MIDFEKAVIFDKSLFDSIGNKMIETIKLDSSKGLMQDDKSGLQYRNKRYIREKGKGIASSRQINRNTAFVDMTLTGDTFKNMTVNATDKGCELVYESFDSKKVQNALDYGYDITTLNQKNIELVAIDIAEQISKNIIEQVNKDIEIKLDITI